MAKVQSIWWGGNSYGHGDITTDLEEFDSLAHAKDVLRDRYDSNGLRSCDTYYVDRDNEAVLFPAVGRESTVNLYEGDYFYGEVRFGPRGGVVVERW